MREWSLKTGDPLSLILASDARLGPTDYLDDQIWELALSGGDPPALSLNTTYGLRARSARIFPRFTEGDVTRNDPAEFFHPPEARLIFPNFVLIAFSPFQDIDVIYEVWVPHSHAICGRVSIANQAKVERKLHCEMVGQLAPIDGQRMAPFEMYAATLLAGYSGGLAPVLFVTGGVKAGSGPYPALALTMHIEAGDKRQFTWVQSALAERDSSFATGRDIASQNWDAARSRLEMLNAGQVEILSGDPNWDAVFMLAQKQAAGLLAGPTPHLPHPSFLITRQPDQGFSFRGDGSDYSHQWNGQSVLEASFLADILVMTAPENIKNLTRNFLAVQEENGAIDWKPGMGGQRNRMLATPGLARMVWRIYRQTEDEGFLVETFDGVRRFLEAWFSAAHDRDGDGIPEWDHPLQTGLDYHPLYSRWQGCATGVDISTSESPGLGAFLYEDCECLYQIAQVIGREAEITPLREKAEKLKQTVDAAWDEHAACYFDWDRDTHISTQSDWGLEVKGSGIFAIRQEFADPIRLQIQIRTDETIRRHPLIFVHGRGASGKRRVERIEDDQFRWIPGQGQLTGKYVYSHLDRIEVRGLEPEDHMRLSSVNYHRLDISLLTPLMAGIPDAKRAKKFIEESITYPGLFWREYGLPICPQPACEADQEVCWNLSIPWNALVGDGLIRYGYRSEAADLVRRLMTAIIQSLRKDRTFRRHYHAETGQGQGESNALNGLAPLGLFLNVLGVRLISSRRVGLAGFNPFPWPVTVKYRGLTILRKKDQTIVTFPDGQSVTVTDPEPRLVTLEVQNP